MASQITHGDCSRQAILRGVDSLANAVRVAPGPRGRHVNLGTAFGSRTTSTRRCRTSRVPVDVGSLSAASRFNRESQTRHAHGLPARECRAACEHEHNMKAA